MLVELIYYKRNGKYYCKGDYHTQKSNLLDIWNEVRELQQTKAPGLEGDAKEFIISVMVPDHPFRHPHLIM